MTHEQMQQASMKAANAALDVFEGIGIRVTSDAVRDAIASHFAPLCEKPKMIPVTDNDGAERLVEVAAEPQVIRKTAEALAFDFHEIYERLAPSFGYETRVETRRFDAQSKNGRLMVAVCQEIISRDGGQTLTLDDTAKDAEIARLIAERDAAVKRAEAAEKVVERARVRSLRTPEPCEREDYYVMRQAEAQYIYAALDAAKEAK